MQTRNIVVIAHDIRSTHNVGSLLRTAEGLGVKTVYLTGYTPYPSQSTDERLPHIAQKLHKQIQKTALGAEASQPWIHEPDVIALLKLLKADGYHVIGLEQSVHSVPLPSFAAPQKVALLLGREVEGIESELLSICDMLLEIPMFGQKESFNVVQATAMALYQLRFASIA
jgi:23S rRNA (guanosine2251-2'-O)-methyltransferase